MRFLAEYALRLEGLAVGTRRRVQLDADPQAPAADLGDDGALDGAEPLDEVAAEPQGALGQFLVLDDVDRGAGDRAGQGVAAEGAAVVAGLEDAEDLVRASTADTG